MAHENFCMKMQHNDNDLFSNFEFSDEASFHLDGKVNRHNLWEEFDYRLDVCCVTNGVNIQQF